MLIKKKTDGGFINPTYERFNRIMGYIAIAAILIIFIVLIGLLFKSWTGNEPRDLPPARLF